MTVGITITNGLEAIVVTDSRGSSMGRESDFFNKMNNLSRDNYSLVTFGTGSADFILDILDNLQNITGSNINDYTNNLQAYFGRKSDAFDLASLNHHKNEIGKKATLIENPDERAQFIRQRLGESMQEYDKSKQSQTNFVLAGFDKELNKIKFFSIYASMFVEKPISHIEIGSGMDGANSYLVSKMQGLDASKMKVEDLLFYALNAYSTSTMNQGVGGRPSIARISKEGCEILPIERTIALTNLSGAYLSDNSKHKLSKTYVKKVINQVLTSKTPDYESVAKRIGLNEGTIRTMCIPYSSWQEQANKFG